MTVRTDLFEHREVQPHFINPCCFGEDFARWLRAQLADLAAAGYEWSEPIQEDYGWGFWLSRGKDTFWIAVSFVDRIEGDTGAEWVVSWNYDPGLSIIRRLFHKPDAAALERIAGAIREALASAEGIRILDEGEGLT